MQVWEALLFGMVQGLTEFLPVSSTAHVVIAELLLGRAFPGLAFEIYLHAASVLAVLVYFRRDIKEVVRGFIRYLRSRLPADRGHFLFGLYIAAATGITGVLGIPLESLLSGFMKEPPLIAAALTLTGIFLIIIERFRSYGERTPAAMRFFDALVVGAAQALSVIPGISRSGATVVASLWAGLSRETAVRYSFLLAVPAILGSSFLAAGDLHGAVWAEVGTPAMAVSFASSFLFSLVGIVWLISFLKQGRLLFFAIYCFTVAFMIFVFSPS